MSLLDFMVSTGRSPGRGLDLRKWLSDGWPLTESYVARHGKHQFVAGWLNFHRTYPNYGWCMPDIEFFIRKGYARIGHWRPQVVQNRERHHV